MAVNPTLSLTWQPLTMHFLKAFFRFVAGIPRENYISKLNKSAEMEAQAESCMWVLAFLRKSFFRLNSSS